METSTEPTIVTVTPESAHLYAPAITAIYNPYVTGTTVSFETEPLSVVAMEQRIKSFSAHGPYLVALQNGKVIGYCYAHLWKERPAYAATYETTVYLAPDAKHHKVGRLLMQHLIKLAPQYGIRHLIACITAENTVSIAFHRTLGFEQVSHFRAVGTKFGRDLDVIDMQYTI